LSDSDNKTSCSFVLIQKNQKIKAAEYFGVHDFPLAHAIQLVVIRPPQTVLLTHAPRSKRQIIHFIPKCSEARFFD
jgi:hypothetical protein